MKKQLKDIEKIDVAELGDYQIDEMTRGIIPLLAAKQVAQKFNELLEVLQSQRPPNVTTVPSEQGSAGIGITNVLQGAEVEEEWPKDGDEYWFLSDDGIAYDSEWGDDGHDHRRRDYTGIYRTKEDALEAKERIIRVIN